jgi:hypothetical protein
LAELVLNFNNFSFDDEHYQQISGVAMGAKMVIMLIIIIIIMLICGHRGQAYFSSLPGVDIHSE